MARVKRHLLANRARIAGWAAPLILFVLWAASADPSERSGLDTVAKAEGESFSQVTLVPTVSAAPKADVPPLVHLTPVLIPEPLPRDIPDNPPLLDSCRQYALGMIETGNDDNAVGGAGEVSRYQIMPSVWKHYNASNDYHDTDVSSEVARRHWLTLYNYFKMKTNREPTDFDLYVLWNTRSGYYASKRFDPARVDPVVRDRACRFANLVELGQSRASRVSGNKGT